MLYFYIAAGALVTVPAAMRYRNPTVKLIVLTIWMVLLCAYFFVNISNILVTLIMVGVAICVCVVRIVHTILNLDEQEERWKGREW
jgi:hypothetical protein